MSRKPATSASRRALGAAGRALPWLLLMLQIAGCFTFLRYAGRLELHASNPDTYGYRYAGRAPGLVAKLANERTLVYPALVSYYDRSGRSWKGIPVLQAAVYFAAVVVFFAGLATYSGSPWLALAAAIPLIYARSHEFLPWALTDSLSVSMTLAVVGLLLLLAARPASWLAWIGLSLAVLLSYHTRPATIFLVGLVPVLAVVIRWLRERRPLRGMLAWGGGLAAATVLPYLLYALLRLVVVGHFGLVSFGGANLIGVTANFLDPWAVRNLPAGELKVLAERMSSRRHDRGWVRLEFNVPIEPYFEQYNDNIWQIAVPVTRRRFRERTEPEMAAAAEAELGYPPPPYADPRPRWVEQNQMMTDLSRELIRLRPFHYLHWVQQAWRLALTQVFDDGWILWLLVLSGVSLPLAWLSAAGGPAAVGAAAGRGSAPRAPAALFALLVAAASYYLIHTQLVCMVSFPISRYVVAASVLWPPFLAAQLFELWRGILTGRPIPPATPAEARLESPR